VTRVATTALFLTFALSLPHPAFAQRSVTDVLSFLLTNRTIATDDPGLDAAAAAATRDTMSRFLLVELATLPALSSSTGFIYRMDRDLGGVVARASDSFGPSFVERSLTTGTRQPAFGLAYQETSFNRIDGRSLSDGTLVATAARLTGDAAPFDVETVAVRVRTRALMLSTNVGVTDRLDVSAALPLVRLTLSGERVDTLRGAQFLQARASVDASGVGDLVLRAKYNVWRRGGTGVAAGAETRLPTGAEENLLGAGHASLKPRLIGSLERGRYSVHGELGYTFGGLSRELDYGGALAVALGDRVTFIGEMLGRRLESGGRLTESVVAHPTLAGIETIRLTGVPGATSRALAVGGIKWNVANTWLVSASVLRSLTSAGLTARVIPSVAVEYSFGR
jgi:hypothetical protein